MPCNDLTEQLTLTIANGKVSDYRLEKLSCGKEVGDQSLLMPWLKGRSVESIVECAPSDLVRELKPNDIVDEFLLMKHFHAIQLGLQDLAHDKNEQTIVKEISIQSPAEIKACAGCAGCF